jgi:hypothetical protein
MTMQRGLTGAKPEAVCRWLFEVMGMFPGSGAVGRAWDAWRRQMVLV